MTYPRHWAYCLDTGEIIGCSTSSALKRRVRYRVARYKQLGYTGGKWRFYHGELDDLRAKVIA